MESGTYKWAPTGTSNVYIKTAGNEKARFTAVATITADCTIFPLVLLASRTTTRCEKGWFGGERNIINPEENPEKIPNPNFNKIQSRENSENYYIYIRDAFTDYSYSGWRTLETWLNYLYTIRFKLFPVHGDF